MYNLLVTADAGAWERAEYVLDGSRFLEHTENELRARLQSLSEAARSELRSYPALFAYETPVDDSARVGTISTIQVRAGQIRLTFQLDQSISPVAPQELDAMAWDLGIDHVEMRRTHWALKSADLLSVMTAAHGRGSAPESIARYFSVPRHDVIGPGVSGDACWNIRRALDRLGLRRPWKEKRTYDEQLAQAVRDFQVANGHSNQDGVFGPGTRTLLIERLNAQRFDFNQLRSVFDFDVVLSFAGEDRAHAEALAGYLKARDLNVFYDKYEQASLWGKNLYAHLHTVYSTRARYCVLFASRHYAQKLWTTHELRAAQERAFSEKSGEYILPIRMDDTAIPGLATTIGYLDI